MNQWFSKFPSLHLYFNYHIFTKRKPALPFCPRLGCKQQHGEFKYRTGRGLVLHYMDLLLPPSGNSCFYLWSFSFHKDFLRIFFHQVLRCSNPPFWKTLLSTGKQASVKELEIQGIVLISLSVMPVLPYSLRTGKPVLILFFPISRTGWRSKTMCSVAL